MVFLLLISEYGQFYFFFKKINAITALAMPAPNILYKIPYSNNYPILGLTPPPRTPAITPIQLPYFLFFSF